MKVWKCWLFECVFARCIKSKNLDKNSVLYKTNRAVIKAEAFGICKMSNIYIYMYIHTYICMCVYMYIYIY